MFLRMKVGTSRSSPLRMFTGVSSKNPRCSDISTNLNSDCSAAGSGEAGLPFVRPNPKNPRDFLGFGSPYRPDSGPGAASGAVSYTHLTLPTKLEV